MLILFTSVYFSDTNTPIVINESVVPVLVESCTFFRTIGENNCGAIYLNKHSSDLTVAKTCFIGVKSHESSHVMQISPDNDDLLLRIVKTCSVTNTNDITKSNILFRFDLGHYEFTNFNISYCNCKNPALWSIASGADKKSKCSNCMLCKNKGNSFAIGDQSTATFENLVITNNDSPNGCLVLSTTGCDLYVKNCILTENTCAYVFRADSDCKMTVTNCKYQSGTISITIGNVIITNSVEVSTPNFDGIHCAIRSEHFCSNTRIKFSISLFCLVLIEGKYLML